MRTTGTFSCSIRARSSTPGHHSSQDAVRVATVLSDGIIGFVTAAPVAGRFELEDLFVDPDWMRRGVGRALVDDVVELARASGVTRIEVDGNPHALAFYESVGFVVDDHVSTEFGPGFRLHLDLSSPSTR